MEGIVACQATTQSPTVGDPLESVYMLLNSTNISRNDTLKCGTLGRRCQRLRLNGPCPRQSLQVLTKFISFSLHMRM